MNFLVAFSLGLHLIKQAAVVGVVAQTLDIQSLNPDRIPVPGLQSEKQFVEQNLNGFVDGFFVPTRATTPVDERLIASDKHAEEGVLNLEMINFLRPFHGKEVLGE
jgi:hypothetical protein